MSRAKSSKMSFGDLIFFGISSILGAGVFLSTAKAYQVGSYHVIWIVILGAIVATVMALAFAEMGGRFSKTGGVYLYAKESFGKGVAFNIGLLRFIILGMALATEGTAISSLLSDFSPIFKMPLVSIGISTLFLAFIFFVNYQGVSSNAKMAKIIEIVVLSTLFVFIISALFHLKSENFVSTLPNNADGTPGHLTFGIFANTFILLFYAFLGFENIGTGAQDFENPKKNIPKAIMIVMMLLAVLYFFVFLCMTGVLGPKLLEVNNGIGAAISIYFGSWAGIFISAMCIVAIFGIGLSQMFSGARSLSPMAEDSFFPEHLARPNKRGVPLTSLITLTVIAFVFMVAGKMLSEDAFKLLLACTTIGRILQYIVVSLGVLVLRRKKGPSEGYQMKMASILVPIVVFFCLIFIIMTPLQAYLSVFGFLVLCLVIYFVYSKPREQKRQKMKA